MHTLNVPKAVYRIPRIYYNDNRILLRLYWSGAHAYAQMSEEPNIDQNVDKTCYTLIFVMKCKNMIIYLVYNKLIKELSKSFVLNV